MTTDPPLHDNESDANARVARVVEDVIRRRAARETVDTKAVIAGNPELMPELGEKLRALRLVEEAEQRAERTETVADTSANNTEGDASTSITSALRTVPTAWPLDSGYEVAIPRVVGNVRIDREIGRGGMGVVFRGWDELLHRQVAIKFLLGASVEEDDPHFERFFGGARAEAAVSHPNIVPVHAAGMVDDIPYIVMDYIDGPTLRELAGRVGRLSLASAVKVMWDVAGALAVLHERDLIHRDVKPSNVLFDRDGNLSITDFGLATLRRRSDKGQDIAGTPTYMAPEAFDGRASPQSDVYAMGIMLFELLAGRYPFPTDVATLRDQHTSAPLPVDELPETIPPSLVETIERAAHKKEMFRYKTAEHFRQALRGSGASDALLDQGAAELTRMLFESQEEEDAQALARYKPSTTTSTYRERLSKIAAEKRQSRLGIVARVMEPDTQQRGPPHISLIGWDCSCVTCGYNLRRMTRDTCCPECGTPVRLSLDGEKLSEADPIWLARVCRGIDLGYKGNIATLVSCIWLLVVTPLVPLAGRRALAESLIAGSALIGFTIGAIGICLSTCGSWLATTPELRKVEFGRLWILRRMARLSGAAVSIVFVASIAVVTMIFVVFVGRKDEVPVAVSWFLVSLAAGLVSVKARYVAHLARRVPAARLAEETAKLARRLGIVASVSLASSLIFLLQVLFVGSTVRRAGVDLAIAFVGFLGSAGLICAAVYVMLLMSQAPTLRRGLSQCLREARRKVSQRDAIIVSKPADKLASEDP